MISRLAVFGTIFMIMSSLPGCTGLFLQPMAEHVITPDQLTLRYRDIDFKADDGQALHGWYLPAEGDTHGSVLFLHGNAENISTHIASVAWMPKAGFNVFLFDYRGYGRSIGEPDLDGAHLDSNAALDALFDQPGIDPERVAVFGQSLGGSIALSAFRDDASAGRIRTLIIEGAFAGYRRIAREKLAASWLTFPLSWPLSYTVSDRHRPVEAIADYAPTPILVIQGEDDTIVPRDHGESLFAAAKKPKQLWLASGIGHIGFLRHESEQQRLADYLREVFRSPPRETSIDATTAE